MEMGKDGGEGEGREVEKLYEGKISLTRLQSAICWLIGEQSLFCTYWLHTTALYGFVALHRICIVGSPPREV
jgi:hypothetical protein